MPTANTNYIDDTIEVFNRVHAGFKYVTDEVQYPESIDDWRIPKDFDRVTGDCDDFAIACRTLLKEKGHKPRLLYCRAETGEGHLICILGKMALDNRMFKAVEITELTRRGYILISVSGTEPGEYWRSVEDVVI